MYKVDFYGFQEVILLFKFNHIAIKVCDLEQTIKFYETLFGFKYEKEIEYQDFKVIFLQNPFDNIFKLELIALNYNDHQNTVINNIPYDHICFETENFDEFFEEIKSSSYIKELPTVTVNDLGVKSMFIFGVNNELIQILGSQN